MMRSPASAAGGGAIAIVFLAAGTPQAAPSDANPAPRNRRRFI
jgi:hypothetical protein